MNQKYVKNLNDYANKYEWIKSSLIEVKLFKPEDFLKIKETLTRIGIASKREKNILFQSCHILHKKIPLGTVDSVRESKYFICHFKELFIFDGKPSTLTDEDIVRRNKIANMLDEWKLLQIVNRDECLKTKSEVCSVKVVPFADKRNWELVPKYNIGKKRN